MEALVADGQRVRAMGQYNSFGHRGWLDSLSDDVLTDVEFVAGDVRDPGSVLAFMDGAATVYHLAALIAIPYSYRAPRSYLETNAGGTLNVLEAARTLGTGRIVHTSTSEVYGTAQTVPIHEGHPLQGQSPYSASKIAADKLAESYHLSFGVPVVTLRPFNTFGPRQSARAVIPTIVSQLAAGQSEISLGLLTPTRDFTYVKDTAQAFLAAGRGANDAVLGQTFNAGTGREVRIGDLVEIIGALMDRSARAVPGPERLRPEGSEVMRLVCDASRLNEATGWRPEHTLEEGLRETIAWFSEPENLARYRWNEYNV